MLITNKVKLISIDRQFTRGAVAMANSFFGRTCYERCVRSCYVRKNALKIPINTGNFSKKINFQAFSTILFRVKPDY